MSCFCYNNDTINTYLINNITNENPCNLCDSEYYDFILYLKYTKQQTYTNIIQTFVNYNKIQKLFTEMIDTKKVWRTIFSSRKTLQIHELMWSYDIPDPWTNTFDKIRLH
jgi:hypothetical protein